MDLHAVIEKCWQGARRRGQLQLGQKQKAWQACRATSFCRASKEKSVFHSCEKPQVSSVWVYQCTSCCSSEIAFREISQVLTVLRFILLFCWFFFAFYVLLEQLRASPELKPNWKWSKKPSNFKLQFILYLQAKCSKENEDVRKAHLTIDSGSLWGISGAL